MAAEETSRLRQAALKAVDKSDWRRAVECYEQLAQIEKNDGSWSQRAAEMHRKLGRSRDAVAAYAQAAEVYSKSGFLLKAIAVCKLILEIEPGHTATQSKLAALHASRTATTAFPKLPARQLNEDSLVRLLPGARPPPGLEEARELSAEIPFDDAGWDSDLGSVEDVARRALPKTPFFSALSERHLVTLIEKVRLVDLAPGRVLFSRGDPGGALFVVASGEISVRAPEEVARLAEGAFFGEIALLIDEPRTASAVAIEPTQVLAIDRTLASALVAEAPDLLRVLLRYMRDRLVATFLRTSPLFSSFSSEERSAVIARFRFVEAQPGLRVLEQGRPPTGLFVLLAGRAAVSRDGAAVAELGAGDVFGEISLLERGNATATVVMERRSFLLLLPRADFDELIMTHPRVLEYVSALAENRRPLPEAHVVIL